MEMRCWPISGARGTLKLALSFECEKWLWHYGLEGVVVGRISIFASVVCEANDGDSSRSAMSLTMFLTGIFNARARFVGINVRCPLTNSGSLNATRNLTSAALIAGCLTPSRHAALLTLCSSRRVSRHLSKLKSSSRSSFMNNP